jgi:hypothetical protein
MVALTACVRRPVRFLAGWSEPAQREKGPSLWNNFRRGVITAQSGDTNTPKNVSLWERKKSSMSTVLAFKSTKRSSPSIDGRAFRRAPHVPRSTRRIFQHHKRKAPRSSWGCAGSPHRCGLISSRHRNVCRCIVTGVGVEL